MHKSVFFLAIVFGAACSSGQTQTTTPDQNPTGTMPSSSLPDSGVPSSGSTSASTGGGSLPPVPTTTTAPTSEPPQAATPDAGRGEKLFADNSCTACHGNKAKPGKKNVFVMKWSDDEKKKAADIIKKGKSPMPGFGDKLNDAQVADLIAYVSAK